MVPDLNNDPLGLSSELNKSKIDEQVINEAKSEEEKDESKHVRNWISVFASLYLEIWVFLEFPSKPENNKILSRFENLLIFLDEEEIEESKGQEDIKILPSWDCTQILIVDDNAFNSQVLSMMIKNLKNKSNVSRKSYSSFKNTFRVRTQYLIKLKSKLISYLTDPQQLKQSRQGLAFYYS